MKWLRAYPSLTAALGADVAWVLVALASSPARPLGPYLWQGEGSPVEIFEVALIVVYMGSWLWIGSRLRSAQTRLPRVLAHLMVVQLVFMLSEELDWCWHLGLPHRNFRQASRGIIPAVMDTPALAMYLLCFVFAPLVPLARVRSWLDRAAPVRAERADAVAAIAGMGGSVLVFLAVGDQELGELHQLVFYAVLGVITVRIARKTAAAA